ncbi:hypothetical protein Gotri_007466 [Gossypium trilobum]|uniref:Uncharacterized protein n=1 Tax=Gossypium trilobum TaxID=34281 RepID=A0A7J9EHR6_9ROSI|nr:hypothetical protein [Gossypium trilobum]
MGCCNTHPSNTWKSIWAGKGLLLGENKRWKMQVITNKFTIDEATKILCIPLAQTLEDDMLAWRRKLLGSTWLEVVTNS